MVKKILKIVGIFLLALLIVAFTIPYLFKNQIKAKITKAINEKVDAKVAFKDADLSLFKSFPRAVIHFTNKRRLRWVNKELTTTKSNFFSTFKSVGSFGELNPLRFRIVC